MNTLEVSNEQTTNVSQRDMVRGSGAEAELVGFNSIELERKGLFLRELPYRALAVAFGSLLGLSAPGFDQWYLAWLGVAPLIVLIVTAREPWLAGVRGWYFATAYSLVYLNWYLAFRHEFCAGTFTFCPAFMCTFFWLVMAAWQGLFVSIFACVLRAVPLTGGWLPMKVSGKWRLPSFVVIPLLWIVIDRMCNCPQLLGSPWPALEYSQYKQLALLQAASIIGGIGITACMLLSNATLLGLVGYRWRALSMLSFSSKPSLIINSLISFALITSLVVFGVNRVALDTAGEKRMISVAAVQSSMSHAIHKKSYVDIFLKHFELSKEVSPGSVCIWPEWSCPVSFTRQQEIVRELAKYAAFLKQTLIMGVIDHDDQMREFNSVCAVESNKIVPDVYHKRYLVPFGEFTPDWVRETPIGAVMYGLKKRYHDSIAGDKVVVLKTTDAAVGPLLCFECLMPYLAVDNVRAGAQLLVDCSNTGWFHQSIVSDQLIAQCTMRAVENHRSFVFATTMGPSVIIDPVGRLLKKAPREKACTISAEVPLESDVTPFTRWSF